MPLSPDEQKILEEIEARLAEEDPRLVSTVSNTSLYAHLARRIRWSAITFLLGFVMLMAFPVSLWIAAGGFGVMLVSSLLIYRYLKALGKDQVRAIQRSGRFGFAAILTRLSGRFRERPTPPPDD
jgi:Protein of unknown function (DUF3040)